MSTLGRALRVGDFALTDFNGVGLPLARVQITAVEHGRGSQSGTMFQVRPALKNCTERDWIDADWFEPSAEEAMKERDALRKALQEADTLMGHEDQFTEWRERWAHLWPASAAKA